jgi:hypothetical protein
MAEQTVDTRWGKTSDGSHVMPQMQSDFLDWLLDDEKDPPSQAAWARTHDVNPRTLREWKLDHRFRAEWDRRAAEKNVSTEKVQGILDMLHKAAEGGDIMAAKLWLEHSMKLRPPVTVVKQGDYAQLSDEDLVKQLKAALEPEDA